MSQLNRQKSITYPKVFLKDILRAFWNGAKPQKWKLLTMVVSLVIANIVIIITPLFYKHFFDVVIAGGSTVSVAKNMLQITI
jgi:ABC-type multidrug transport system fused ATPase/permease subunit